VRAILGRCIKSKKFSTGKRWMWIPISGCQIDELGTLRSGIVTGWGDKHSGKRCCWLQSRLSASVGCGCTCSFASPACLRMLRSAIVAGKASSGVVLIKYSPVSFYRSLHLAMPRKLHICHLLISDLGARLLHQIFCFPHCRARKPFFGHCGHIQGQAHVDCSVCTWPPCLAIVADMLTTYKK